MIYAFGDCELDLARGELRRGGQLCHVEPQVFAVLAYLVEHRDRLVTSAELLEHVWQNRYVTPATLNSRLKAVRHAIGDDGREQQIIRTLRGRGFRFVAPVRATDAASPAAAQPPYDPTREAPPAYTTLDLHTGEAMASTLARARGAFVRAAWREAYDLFAALDARAALDAEDLERFAEAAWWIMDSVGSVRSRERAYRAYVRAGDERAAGRIALALAEDHFHRLARAVAQGWFRRAERHLAGAGDSPERGWLFRMRAVLALAGHRYDDALLESERALAVARRARDADLEALTIQDRGRILVALGRVAEGMALIDEAMAAVSAGALTPHTTGRTYCNMISTCDQLGDFGRAVEWHDAAARWSAPYGESGFPGICRVYRAGLLRLRGELPEAEREARRATEELADFLADIAGEAFYELGEIRLRAGDLPAAEAMFAEAHARGREPQPGLALLRLAEDNRGAARAMIERALADPQRSPLERAKLLPAFVSVMVACDALDDAARGATELEDIVATYDAPALVAWSALARGEVELARGHAAEAVRYLGRARRTWSELDLPFELARTRLLLARAHAALGHDEEAALEERAGRAALERVGTSTLAR